MVPPTIWERREGGTVTLNKVSDGLSNTAIFSEWVRGKNIGNADTSPGQLYVATIAFPTATTFVPLVNYLNGCQNSTMIYPAYDRKGWKWLNQTCGEGGCYSHIMTPNLKACLYSNVVPDAGQTLTGTS